MLILAINPGSTSTKLAVYEDEKELLRKSVSHPLKELQRFDKPSDQREYRTEVVEEFLKSGGYTPADFSCIVARGAAGLPPIHGGAYRINQNMIDRLTKAPTMNGNTNLAALIAYDLATPHHIPCFIYDGVSVDEMLPYVHISGLKDYPRVSRGHTLNSRAVARRTAEQMGKPYEECVFIVAHIGGGYSVDIHVGGKLVDVIEANEGCFTTERAGGMSGESVIKIIKEHDLEYFRKATHGWGGLVSHFGTNDAQKVSELIAQGDTYAKTVIDGMAYFTARSICSLAAMTSGKVDAIILTGGLAKFTYLAEEIKKRVSFLASVVDQAGEFELEALALGGLRVMRGEEEAENYRDEMFRGE